MVPAGSKSNVSLRRIGLRRLRRREKNAFFRKFKLSDDDEQTVDVTKKEREVMMSV